MPFAKPAHKNRLAAAVVLAGSALLSAAALAITPILVTETTDDGTGVIEGSFSWALQQAAATNGASTIVVATDGDIDIMATLEYGGTRGLTIIGSDQVIRAMDDFTLLAATEGADLTVTGLQFEGPGGFDLNNQSAAENPGKGIFVKVPEDATGRVDLKLTNVAVRGVANHGIHVSDCNLADDCGGGSGGDGGGSAASIVIHATNLVIEDAGNGKFDADGLRVDERDGGSIIAYIHGSAFMGVGADGVELDEGQNGS